MKISDLRDWAASTYGAHSHKEGQLLAALGPLEEWLGHLQRFGIQLELTPVRGFVATPPSPALHEAEEPPAGVNAGAIGTEADAFSDSEPLLPAPSTFVVAVPALAPMPTPSLSTESPF